MKNKYTLSIIAGLLAGYTAITPGISRAEIAAGGAGDTAKEPTPLPKRVSVHTECIPGQKIDTTVTDTDGTGRTITYVCPSSGKKKKADMATPQIPETMNGLSARRIDFKSSFDFSSLLPALKLK